MKFRQAMHAPMIEAAAAADWELAKSVQITPADLGGEHTGHVSARPNATGWFISARCRRGLDGRELAQFKDFVVHSVYLLLQQGPQAGVWTPGAVADEWRAHPHADLSALRELPAVLPPQWKGSRAA